MLNRISGLFFFSLVVLLATACTTTLTGPDVDTKPSKSMQEQLADQNFVVGDVLEFIPAFELDGWTYIDPRNISVNGEGPGRYLVVLQNTCYGLTFPDSWLLPKQSKSDRLARNDTFLIKNKGMTIAHCKVKEVRRLDPS